MQSSHANESKWSMQTDQHKACKYIDASLLQSQENMQTDKKQIMQIHLILLYFNQNQRCKLIKTWLYKSKSWFFTLFQLFVDSFLMFVNCMIAWFVFCDCMNFVLFHFAWLHASCCLRFMIWCWCGEITNVHRRSAWYHPTHTTHITYHSITL